MMSTAPNSALIAPITEHLQQHVSALHAVVTELLPTEFGIHASDHIADITQALVLAHPGLALAVFEATDAQKARFGVRKALELLRSDDPILFQADVGEESAARLWVLDLNGQTRPSENLLKQGRGAFGTGEERRRSVRVILHRLHERGRSKDARHIIETYPIPPAPPESRGAESDYRRYIDAPTASRTTLPSNT